MLDTDMPSDDLDVIAKGVGFRVFQNSMDAA